MAWTNQSSVREYFACRRRATKHQQPPHSVRQPCMSVSTGSSIQPFNLNMAPPRRSDDSLHDGWKRASISGELRMNSLYRSGPDQSYDGLRAALRRQRVAERRRVSDPISCRDMYCSEQSGGISDRNVWTPTPGINQNGFGKSYPR